jgi:hypothetical protein
LVEGGGVDPAHGPGLALALDETPGSAEAVALGFGVGFGVAVGVGPGDLLAEALGPAGTGPTYEGVTVTFTAPWVAPVTVTNPSWNVVASAGEPTVI